MQFSAVSIDNYVVTYAAPCIFQQMLFQGINYLFYLDPVLSALTNAGVTSSVHAKYLSPFLSLW